MEECSLERVDSYTDLACVGENNSYQLNWALSAQDPNCGVAVERASWLWHVWISTWCISWWWESPHLQ